jgi:hypothetical protein
MPMFEQLLHFADPAATNQASETFVIRGMKHGNTMLLGMLLQNGLIDRQALGATDASGNTILHLSGR